MLNKYLFLFFILIQIALNGKAQSTISGTVHDKSGEALTGANIYLKGTYDGVSSDAEGNFSFSTDETGKQTLRIDFIGYEGFEKELDLNNSSIRADVVLHETFNQMKAVTITAGTFEAGDARRSASMTSLDMVTTAGAMGSVFGALQTLPGTSSNPESGKLFVKGGSSEESQTYIDGMLVHVPYTSSPPLTSARGRFNPFMFKGTVFSTGGYSAEYGQALSSVLQLTTNDMPVEDELNISLLSVSAGLAGTKTWSDGAITASIDYTNLKPYMSIAPQNYDWNHHPEYITSDVSIRQKTGKSGMLKLYGSFFRSNMSLYQTDLSNDGQQIAYKLKNNNSYINGSWNTPLGSKWIYKIGLSVSESQDQGAYMQSKMDEELQGLHYKNVFIHQLSQNKVNLRLGADLFLRHYETKLSTGDSSLTASYQDILPAAFAEAEIYLSNKFVSRVGGRMEYNNYLGNATFSPRFSTAYKIGEQSQVSLAYGWFYQSPLDQYLLYTNQVKPERADHYILTFQSIKNKRTFRSEIYYKDYQSLVKVEPDIFYRPEAYSNSGDGYAYGLDVFWRDNKSIRNAEYWISYSYLETERDFRDYPYRAIPGFASKHNLSVVFKYWFDGIRSLAGLSYKYASPRVFNDPNLPGFNNQETIAYQSLDVNITYLHRENIIFYAAITNILGFKQEYGERYAMQPDADGHYAGEPIIPGSNRFFVLACFITLSKKGNLNQLDKIE